MDFHQIVRIYLPREVFVDFYSDMLNRNAMIGLQDFTTSILLINKYKGRKLKILGTILKSEEILHVYLIFCAFGDFYCDVIYRKRPCLVGVY